MRSSIFPMICKESLHIVRDRRSLAITFIAPLVQLIMLGYAATSDVRNVPLAIYDQDRSQHSRQLIDAFVRSSQFALAQSVASEQELAHLVDAGNVRAALIIPPHYAGDLARGHGA